MTADVVIPKHNDTCSLRFIEQPVLGCVNFHDQV